jgi:hypothetical protein
MKFSPKVCADSVKGVDFLGLARAEYLDAQAFYESKVPGLGFEFRAELNQVSEFLLSHPAVGKLVGPRTRSWPLRRFPFTLIYAELAEGVLVVAVAHQRRRPGYWRSRIHGF